MEIKFTDASFFPTIQMNFRIKHGDRHLLLKISNLGLSPGEKAHFTVEKKLLVQFLDRFPAAWSALPNAGS